MLKIGDFSKLSRISIRMLRHYNEIGLLIPKSIDDFTGYRYYSEAQLPVANRITALKDMGFSLGVIGQILSQYNDSHKLKTYLQLKQREIKEEADILNQRLLLLESTLNRLGKDDNIMNYNVTLKELPERTVASVRKVIPSYDQEGMLWHILMNETEDLQIQDDNPCYTLAIFHDGEHKEQDVDVEVQKSVKGNYKNTENVVFKRVAPIQMASATYQGSYEKVNEVNEAVANWVRDNGYEFNGLSFCIYHVSPYETQNPEKWVTEVCYPVKKK
ncbi:MerR family transcriptional regulator [Clostridium sporogenes]|uniref:MerR family transcriptional regulator n=1 Tax=Clostridium sporogenes TaxID=1509 RepID=UPI0013D509CA|nr:MerR family transcriptional regulator [Clostridium sporogenes]NFE80658.1 MerR family transcriptional regulator [Clostridium sporogenes]NFG68864.1 MerR family transcriptional regulator [Clostridium sporogenes]